MVHCLHHRVPCNVNIINIYFIYFFIDTRKIKSLSLIRDRVKLIIYTLQCQYARSAFYKFMNRKKYILFRVHVSPLSQLMGPTNL